MRNMGIIVNKYLLTKAERLNFRGVLATFEISYYE